MRYPLLQVYNQGTVLSALVLAQSLSGQHCVSQYPILHCRHLLRILEAMYGGPWSSFFAANKSIDRFVFCSRQPATARVFSKPNQDVMLKKKILP
jgi:hypothetical protein